MGVPSVQQHDLAPVRPDEFAELAIDPREIVGRGWLLWWRGCGR